MAGKIWTKEELKILEELYNSDDSISNIQKVLGRQESSVLVKANRLGYRRNTYTLDQINTKIQNKFTHLQLQEFHGVSNKARILDTRCEHTWEVYPTHILQGKCITCPVCNITNHRKTKEQFFSLLVQRGYQDNIQDIVEYTQSKELIRLKYTCGHVDMTNAGDLLSKGTKQVCRVCIPQRTSIKDPELFNKEFLKVCGDTVQLLDTYINDQTYLKVQCAECHNIWEIQPHNFLAKGTGCTCRKCSPIVPTGTGIQALELDIRKYIEQVYEGWIVYNDRTILEGKELDIVVPDKGLAIEINGQYWHSQKFKDSNFHKDKQVDTYNSIGFQVLHIYEHEWHISKPIIKQMIQARLGLTEKVHARKCNIRKIAFPAQFLEDNHIQGAGAPTQINYGLFLNEQLVAVATFGKPRFTEQYEYELIRYCSKLNTNVQGGASKLFKAFIKEFSPVQVLTYCNLNYGRGGLYEKLGFKYLKDTQPDYWYVRGRKKVSRYKAMKHKLPTLVPEQYDEALQEQEIMHNAGYLKIYGCGNKVFIYTV